MAPALALAVSSESAMSAATINLVVAIFAVLTDHLGQLNQ